MGALEVGKRLEGEFKRGAGARPTARAEGEAAERGRLQGETAEMAGGSDACLGM